MCCSRVVQEPGSAVPEKIRSISGANKRRHSSESEEESSSEEEKEEHKQKTEKSSAINLNAVEKPEEGTKKPLVNQQAVPTAPVCRAASNRLSCKPVIFIPVDRSPEIQVRLKAVKHLSRALEITASCIRLIHCRHRSIILHLAIYCVEQGALSCKHASCKHTCLSFKPV